MTKSTNEKAHNPGSEFHREGASAGGTTSGRTNSAVHAVIDDLTEAADKAIAQVAELGKAASDAAGNKDSRNNMLAGAAVGGIAALVLPFVSIPLGLVAGAGYAADREAQKRG